MDAHTPVMRSIQQWVLESPAHAPGARAAGDGNGKAPSTRVEGA